MTSTKPNIIYIYADDLGRGMLSCYGQKLFATPNIDRLAQEGRQFSRAYGCAFCAPARASLITGTHDCHRGGWTYTRGGIYQRVAAGAMSFDETTELISSLSHHPQAHEKFLAEIPRQAGYVTGQIGKLEWGFATTPAEIQRHGWDYHYGYYDHVDCHGFYPPYLFENGHLLSVPGNTRPDHGKAVQGLNDPNSPAAREERWNRDGRAVYSQDLFDQKIITFIRQHQDQPFFLYHPSQLPHGPIIIPEIHPAVKDHPQLTDYEKEYASMVLRLDQTVGLILNELEQLEIDDNTLVMFSSDNGHSVYYQEEHRTSTTTNIHTGEKFDNVDNVFTSESGGDIFNGNDSMSGLKFSNLEGGVRLPFIARWPGTIAAGSHSDRLIASYDLLATLSELLHIDPGPNTDSVSFLSALSGDHELASSSERGTPVIFAARLGPALVTDDGWKLRQITLPGVNRYVLNDLRTDRYETTNLNYAQPELIDQLGPQLLRACDGNFSNGMFDSHHVWYPGIHFHGPDCDWQDKPLTSC